MHGDTFHAGRPMSLFQKFPFNDIDVIDGLENVKQHCCNVLVVENREISLTVFGRLCK